MKTENVLLSVVVPTKNRYGYLKSFIQSVCSFGDSDLELVIQDNSDNNEEILTFLAEGNFSNVVYNYDNSPMPMTQNSDLAVKNSRGKYVCFMGDDDLISDRLCDFVRWMDREGCESAFFNRAQYFWPGVTHRVHKMPSLRIPHFKGKVRAVNVEKETAWLLATGAVDLRDMPQLYHGVVLRACLDKVYEKTGTYFPGPSPDMAVSVALGLIVKKHVICDMPLISAGASPKSAAGLGAKHMHKGNLKDISALPKNTEEVWEQKVPKVWTGPTIYAESALKALRAMDADKEVQAFNYTYHYAYFSIFCRGYKAMLAPFKKDKSAYRPVNFYAYIGGIFVKRCFRFAYNLLASNFHMFGIYVDDVKTSQDAQVRVDQELSGVKAQCLVGRA